MSASWGIRLVDAVVRDGRLGPIRDAGITPEMLSGPARVALDFILRFADQPSTKGRVPPREYVDQHVPIIEWPGRCDASTPLDTLCQLVKAEYVRREIEIISEEVNDLAEDDPFEAAEMGRRRFAELTTSSSDSIQVVDGLDGLTEMLQERQRRLTSGEGLLGLPFPWKVLNEATLGIQEGDVVLYYGLPKSMKTWLALLTAAHVFMTTDARIMIYTPEMRVQQMQLRLASLFAEVDYTKPLKGWKDPEEEAYFYQICRDLEAAQQDPDGPGNRLWFCKGDFHPSKKNPLGTLPELVEAFEPALLVLDSAYHLADDLDPKVLARFNRAVKRMTDDLRVRTVYVNQENEIRAVKAAMAGKDPRTSTSSGGQSIIESCDIAIRVIKMLKGGRARLSLLIQAARETTLEGFTINGRPAYDFSFQSLKRYSLEDALHGEKPQADTSSPKRKPKRVGVGILDKVAKWDK